MQIFKNNLYIPLFLVVFLLCLPILLPLMTKTEQTWFPVNEYQSIHIVSREKNIITFEVQTNKKRPCTFKSVLMISKIPELDNVAIHLSIQRNRGVNFPPTSLSFQNSFTPIPREDSEIKFVYTYTCHILYDTLYETPYYKVKDLLK